MGKKNCFMFIVSLVLSLSGCAVPVENPGDLRFKEKSAKPGDVITVYITGEGRVSDVRMSCNYQYEDSTASSSKFDCGVTGDYLELVKRKNNSTIKVRVPDNAVTCELWAVVTNTDGSPGCVGVQSYGHTLRVIYPEIVTLDKTVAAKGDKITLTSSKPFFNESSFSREKVEQFLSEDYFIVWVESDKEFNNGNFITEKYPVSKDYYDLDSITPTSITFTVPEIAKTGRIHVINEDGFSILDSKGDALPNTSANKEAYYSTDVDLTIKE